MSIITTSSTPNLLVAGIKKSFGVGMEGYKSNIEKVFDIETSAKEAEFYQEEGGLGRHKLKAEMAQAQLDSIVEGPQTTIRNLAYALSYQISHEAEEDNLYPQILRKALMLGKSAMETKEAVAFDRLNTAFSNAAADLLANGQPMCSTSQPLLKSPESGSATDANRPTTAADLSEESLTIDMNNIAGFRDPAGLKTYVSGELLIVPQALDVTATKLLYSTLESESANNAVNVFGRGMGRIPQGHVVSQFLTDEDAYFIRTNQEGLVFQKRQEPTIKEDMLLRQYAKEILSYMRFAVGCYNYRSIYGNPGQ